MYDDVIARLRGAYDQSAGEREAAALAGWKYAERERVLSVFLQEGTRTLLEIGAGTGKDALFFQQHGLDVTCIDLSPAMVALCRQKGLRADVGDVLHLSVPAAAFDAVYSLNCLLHVPKRDLPAALAAIRQAIRPGGICYLGLYGGIDMEGVWADDRHEPKRFFSYHTDEGIQEAVRPYFQILSFTSLDIERGTGLHFQSLLLRR